MSMDQSLRGKILTEKCPALDHGDIVYLRTDPDRLERVVTGWIERPHVGRTYLLTCVAQPETHHYPCEITTERPNGANGGPAGFKNTKA